MPGVGFIGAVPQHRFLWSRTDDVACHVRRYRKGELEGKLRNAGFSIRFSTSYTAVLLPLMMASRLWDRRQPDRPVEHAVWREFELPRFVNAGLRLAREAEVSITLAGFAWPAGGSRIVVAQKPNC